MNRWKFQQACPCSGPQIQNGGMTFSYYCPLLLLLHSKQPEERHANGTSQRKDDAVYVARAGGSGTTEQRELVHLDYGPTLFSTCANSLRTMFWLNVEGGAGFHEPRNLVVQGFARHAWRTDSNLTLPRKRMVRGTFFPTGPSKPGVAGSAGFSTSLRVPHTVPSFAAAISQ